MDYYLKENRRYLDLSSVESCGVPLNGTDTPTKNGKDAVGYQGRKDCKATNSIFMSDNNGVMIAMSTLQEEEHCSAKAS